MKMKKKILAVLAALILGAIALPGCYIGPWWGEPGWHEEHEGHEGRWERHHEGRRGALTPREDRQRRDGNARHVHDGRDVG